MFGAAHIGPCRLAGRDGFVGIRESPRPTRQDGVHHGLRFGGMLLDPIAAGEQPVLQERGTDVGGTENGKVVEPARRVLQLMDRVVGRHLGAIGTAVDHALDGIVQRHERDASGMDADAMQHPEQFEMLTARPDADPPTVASLAVMTTWMKIVPWLNQRACQIPVGAGMRSDGTCQAAIVHSHRLQTATKVTAAGQDGLTTLRRRWPDRRRAGACRPQAAADRPARSRTGRRAPKARGRGGTHQRHELAFSEKKCDPTHRLGGAALAHAAERHANVGEPDERLDWGCREHRREGSRGAHP